MNDTKIILGVIVMITLGISAIVASNIPSAAAYTYTGLEKKHPLQSLVIMCT
jgi:hypothetical protein